LKIVFNYDLGTIKTTVFDNLLSEILLAKAGQKSILWLVSPWIKDFDFPLVGRGGFTPVLSIKAGTITLLDLLKEYSDAGGKIKLVCYPPHLLFDMSLVTRVVELTRVAAQLRKAKILEPAVEENLSLLKSEAAFLADQFSIHGDVIEFINSTAELNGAEIYYNEKLHAKVILGTNFAIVGSANITPGGFIRNDEIYLVVDEERTISDVKMFCENMILAEGVRRFFVKRRSEYRLEEAIGIDLIADIVKEFSNLPLTMRESLVSCGVKPGE